MAHEVGFDAVCYLAHAFCAAGSLVAFYGGLCVGVSAPNHGVLEACAGGYGGGDAGGSECVEVEVWPSGLDLGFVEMVA